MKEKINDTIKSLLAVLLFMIIILILSSIDVTENEEIKNNIIKETQVQARMNINN